MFRILIPWNVLVHSAPVNIAVSQMILKTNGLKEPFCYVHGSSWPGIQTGHEEIWGFNLEGSITNWGLDLEEGLCSHVQCMARAMA